MKEKILMFFTETKNLYIFVAISVLLTPINSAVESPFPQRELENQPTKNP